MKRSLPEIQYARLLAMYSKLNARLNRHFILGRFADFTKAQQYKLISRLERIKAQLQRLERVLKLGGSAFLIGAALYSSDVQAQFAVQGSEFRVNTYTTSDQSNASVAMDADGDFVVVWRSSGQDGNNNGIYGQRYNASGVAQGSEFLVNMYTTSDQSSSSVAMDADGDFVVVWQSSGQDGSSNGIYGQRYNAAGLAQGSEFLVNTYTTSNQSSSSVAMDADGDFVVVWQSSGQDGSSNGIYGQRYNAAGLAQGSEFLVNTYTTSDQSNASVAMDADGDFVVVWESVGQDGNNYGVYGQRYNAAGLAQGSEFLVNTSTYSSQKSASVAMDSDGDFVVVWDSSPYNYYSNNRDIYGQRYNAAGVAQGGEFQVNSYTTSFQSSSSVAMDVDGDFVVVWQSSSQDGNNYGVYGQRYNAAGLAQGSEFLVNTYTTSDQSGSSVAMDADGDFAVVWQSAIQDGNNYGIYAQRYGETTTTSVELWSVLDEGLMLYPNPAQEDVFLNLEGEANIKVLDLSGQVVKETQTSNQSFSIAGLQAGVYLIEVTQGEAKAIKKLVVK